MPSNYNSRRKRNTNGDQEDTLYFVQNSKVKEGKAMVESMKDSIEETHFFKNSSVFILDILQKCSDYVTNPLQLKICFANTDFNILFCPLKSLDNLKITSLYLWASFISLNLKRVLLKGLKNSYNIRTLYVIESNIKLEDVKEMSSILKNDEVYIEKLILVRNKFDRECLNEIFDGLIQNKSIKRVIIRDYVVDEAIGENYVLHLLENRASYPNLIYYDVITDNDIRYLYIIKTTKDHSKITIKLNQTELDQFTQVLKAILNNKNIKVKEIDFNIRKIVLLTPIDEEIDGFYDVYKKIKDRNIIISVNNERVDDRDEFVRSVQIDFGKKRPVSEGVYEEVYTSDYEDEE